MAVEELEDHLTVPCAELRTRLPFLDIVRVPVRPMIGFCLFATQMTTSGVALYHIPKNLAVELAGEKNPSSKIWAGEARTWPSEKVWPGESVEVAASRERSRMAKRERAAQRIRMSCSISRERMMTVFCRFCMNCK